MQKDESLQEVGEHLQQHAIILGVFVATIWLLEVIDRATGSNLDHFGIVPREIIGLRGIFAAPLLHGGFGHVAANTLPFIILGWLVLLHGTRTFFIVTAVVVLIGGMGTWLIAPSASIHIGASGLIFGYFGYLLFRGYFERSWQSILLSAVVLVVYGGMLLGLLPTALPVSWQMHLFGFLGGALAAYALSKDKEEEDSSIEIRL